MYLIQDDELGKLAAKGKSGDPANLKECEDKILANPLHKCQTAWTTYRRNTVACSATGVCSANFLFNLPEGTNAKIAKDKTNSMPRTSAKDIAKIVWMDNGHREK